MQAAGSTAQPARDRAMAHQACGSGVFRDPRGLEGVRRPPSQRARGHVSHELSKTDLDRRRRAPGASLPPGHRVDAVPPWKGKKAGSGAVDPVIGRGRTPGRIGPTAETCVPACAEDQAWVDSTSSSRAGGLHAAWAPSPSVPLLPIAREHPAQGKKFSSLYPPSRANPLHPGMKSAWGKQIVRIPGPVVPSHRGRDSSAAGKMIRGPGSSQLPPRAIGKVRVLRRCCPRDGSLAYGLDKRL